MNSLQKKRFFWLSWVLLEWMYTGAFGFLFISVIFLIDDFRPDNPLLFFVSVLCLWGFWVYSSYKRDSLHEEYLKEKWEGLL